MFAVLTLTTSSNSVFSFIRIYITKRSLLIISCSVVFPFIFKVIWYLSAMVATTQNEVGRSDVLHFIIYVVVQFGFWFNLDFPLFFSMLIYDNEYQTKENQN